MLIDKGTGGRKKKRTRPPDPSKKEQKWEVRPGQSTTTPKKTKSTSGSSGGGGSPTTSPPKSPKKNNKKGKKGKKGKNPASSPASSVNPGDYGLAAIRTIDQLRALAAAEVANAISAEVAPYTSALGQAQSGQKASLTDLTEMFGTIMPAVTAAVDEVQSSYGQAEDYAQSIFDQTAAYLGDLRESREAEGMRLSEQVGGPVEMSDFTGAVDLEQQAFNQAAAGDMLNVLAQAQAGAQEASAFATNVLPLVQKEEMAEIKRRFDVEMKGLREEIARIKSTRADRTNARLQELLTSEREYLLAKTQAERDWQVSLQSLKNERERLEMDRAALYGVDANGNLTLDAVNAMTATELDAKIENQKQKERAGQLIMQITQGGEQTSQQWFPVPPNTSGAVMDPNSPTGWSVIKDIKTNVEGVSHPNDIYDYLIINGVTPKVATWAIRKWLGEPKWKRGKKITLPAGMSNWTAGPANFDTGPSITPEESLPSQASDIFGW